MKKQYRSFPGQHQVSILMAFLICISIAACKKEKDPGSNPKVRLDVFVGSGVDGNMQTRVYEYDTGIYSAQPGKLYALKPDGTEKWAYTHTTALFSPVLDNDGNIYVQDFYNKVLSFNRNGYQRWTYEQYAFTQFENVGQRCPAVGSDGTIYVGACGLHALDPLNGRRKWVLSAGSTVKASPSIGPDGTIYIVMGSSNMVAVGPGGTEKWKTPFAHPWETSFSPPAVDRNGTAYLGVEGKDQGIEYSNIYAFNSDGTIKWKYQVEGGRFVRASPVIDMNGNIIIATKANELIEPARVISLSSSGQKLWQYTIENVHDTGDDIYCTPSIDNYGMIYFGDEAGFLYVLNPDGTLNNRYQLPCSVNWSSPVITGDGILYLGGIQTYITEPGIFTAIKISGTGYGSSDWPKFRHDNHSSGRFGSK